MTSVMFKMSLVNLEQGVGSKSEKWKDLVNYYSIARNKINTMVILLVILIVSFDLIRSWLISNDPKTRWSLKGSQM